MTRRPPPDFEVQFRCRTPVRPSAIPPSMKEIPMTARTGRRRGLFRTGGLVAAGLQALGGPYADVLLGTPERDKYDGKGYEG